MDVAKSFVMHMSTFALIAVLRFAALAWTTTRRKDIGVIRTRCARYAAPFPALGAALLGAEVDDDRATCTVLASSMAGAGCPSTRRLRFLDRAVWAAHVDLLSCA